MSYEKMEINQKYEDSDISRVYLAEDRLGVYVEIESKQGVMVYLTKEELNYIYSTVKEHGVD